VVSFTPGRFTPGTHWIGSWVGPRANLGAVAKRKILSPCRELDPGRPAHSQALYRLSYPGSHQILLGLPDLENGMDERDM